MKKMEYIKAANTARIGTILSILEYEVLVGRHYGVDAEELVSVLKQLKNIEKKLSDSFEFK